MIADRRPNEALREAKAGLALDPLSLGSNYNYAFILIHAGEPAEAIQHLQGLLDREPENEVIYGYLGRAYAGLHEYHRAADSFKRAMELSELKYQYEANWAYALAKSGDVGHARKLVDELEAKARSGVWIPASTMTEAYIGLGDTNRAFFWFNRCVTERSCTLLEANTEPFYSGLSGDSRFRKITAPLFGDHSANLQATVMRK